MAEKNSRRNQTTDALFDAILSLRTREECYNFFEDLCTVKEISDMAQRLEAAKMLLDGSTYDQIVKAVQISGAIPKVQGAPMHIGDPSVIGVKDIDKPEFGDPVDIYPGEVPVFWACGVTPQSVVMQSRPAFAITHAPGHMLITDTKNVDLKG